MKRPSTKNRTNRILVHDSETQISVPMGRKRRFLAWSVLAVPVFLAPALLVMFLLLFGGNQVARDLLSEFNGRPIDVVYFGDSVVRAYSGCELHTEGIDDLLRASSPSTIATVAGAGYTAQQHAVLTKLFDVTDHKPRVAIVPINMRSLSPTWGDNPDWQFGSDMQYVRILSGEWRSIPTFIATSLLSDGKEEKELFLQSDVMAAGINYGSLEELFKQAAGVPLNLECEINADIYGTALRARFTTNYMFDLQKDHRLLKTVVAFAGDLRDR